MKSYRIAIPRIKKEKKRQTKKSSVITQDLPLYKPWTWTNIKYFTKFLQVHYKRSTSFLEAGGTAGTADPD